MSKKKPPTSFDIFRSIQKLTTLLVQSSLVDDQEWPSISSSGNEVTTLNPINSTVLKNVDYPTLYEKQLNSRAFNVVFLDKAMIQMSYWFSDNQLERHRLAFLPAPDLSIYQSDPEIYLDDILFAEVVGSQAASVPIRMDYDIREGVGISDEHPAAHLTLGQYQHCRIPINAPVTPSAFVDFIVRHFYSTPTRRGVQIDPELDIAFPLSPYPVSDKMLHLVSPGKR